MPQQSSVTCSNQGKFGIVCCGGICVFLDTLGELMTIALTIALEINKLIQKKKKRKKKKEKKNEQ